MFTWKYFPPQFWKVIFLVIRYLVESISGPLSAVPPILWSSSRAFSSSLFSEAPRYLEYARSHQHSETGETETSPSGSPQKSWNVGCMLYSSLSPWRRGCQAVSASVSCITGPLGQQHTAQLFFVHSSLQASRACHVPSALRDRWDRRQSIRQPPWKVRTLDHCPIFSFSPQRASGSWGFLPSCVTLLQGRDYGERVPGIFLLALTWLVLHLPEVQRTFILFCF